MTDTDKKIDSVLSGRDEKSDEHHTPAAHGAGELPDDLRIPLHELQADAPYLIGRVAAENDMAGSILQSLETKLSHVAEAAYRLNGARHAAEAAVTAWRDVFFGIEAHIKDRVAMGDHASPETYLSIIRTDVADVQRRSQQIVNARWADSARHQTEINRLREQVADFDANVDRLKACEHIADGDDGWETLRNECPSTAAVARLQDRCAAMKEALEQVRALIGVTMGEGAEATIPETVPTRLGIPVRAADIMRNVDAALALLTPKGI